MALYFTINSLPEMRSLSPDERRAVIRTAGGPARLLRVYVMPAYFGLLGALVGGGCILPIDEPTAKGIAGLTCFALLFIAALQWQLLVIRSALRLQIKRMYAGRRLPLCLRCAYDLTAATGDRCPECGAAIVVPPAG